jgi:anthranilate synthase component 1
MEQPKYYPTLEQVKGLAGQGNITPIYRELMADLETPVSAYLKVCRDEPYSFLLESVEGGEHLARYSFMGCEPYLILKLDKGTAYARQNNYKQTLEYKDPLEVLQSHLKSYELVEVPGLANELPRFYGGAVGYLGYENVRYFEKLPAPEKDAIGMPEAIFVYVDTMLVFDHLKRKIKVVSHVHLDAHHGNIEQAYADATDRIERLAARLNKPVPLELLESPTPDPRPLTPDPQSNLTQEEYEAAVLRTKEYIKAGDIFQANVGQRFSRPTSAKPINVYRALRAVNPSPYMFYLHYPEGDIIGASPELLVQVEDRVVATHPIAGTRPRGKDAAEDAKMAEELVSDEKERAEHVMLVDLGRNDVGRVSKAGSVRVEELMHIERYSHVMHMVTNVKGELKPELSAFDALRACFPMGTVTGAPKIRAMEIIAEQEGEKRGPYGGAVGYFSFSGNMDTCLTIRTVVLKDGVAHVRAAAGIVADSVPLNEYHETRNKARAMLRALDEAEKL